MLSLESELEVDDEETSGIDVGPTRNGRGSRVAGQRRHERTSAQKLARPRQAPWRRRHDCTHDKTALSMWEKFFYLGASAQVLGLLLLAPTAAQGAASEPDFAAIDAYVEAECKRTACPGRRW